MNSTCPLTTLLEYTLCVRPADHDKKLALITGVAIDEIRESVAFLVERYNPDRSGIVLVTHGESLQFVTHPDAAESVASLLDEDRTGELTRAALETLAVVSYRGPISRPGIEEIRGVNCSLTLRNLLIRGLVESRDTAVGEKVYSISLDFLRSLGLQKTDQLPDFDSLNTPEGIDPKQSVESSV